MFSSPPSRRVALTVASLVVFLLLVFLFVFYFFFDEVSGCCACYGSDDTMAHLVAAVGAYGCAAEGTEETAVLRSVGVDVGVLCDVGVGALVFLVG